MAQNKPKGLRKDLARPCPYGVGVVHEKEAADAIEKTALEQAKNKEGVSPSEKDALDKLVKEAQSADIEKVAPSEVQKKEWHTSIEISQLINELSKNMGVSPQVGLIATILLFNKGADCQSNEGTPKTMYVSVGGESL
jgi:hypothetical protein